MKKITLVSELKILFTLKKNRNKLIFENLTMAPIEKDLIIREKLNTHEIEWLNNYHKAVFKNIKKFMNKIETMELKRACSDI